MSEMASEVLGKVSIHIAAYVLISGAILLLLSPIILWLSPLINPIFSGAENAINSLIILSILCLVGGIPMLLLRELICGTNGMNDRVIRILLNGKTKDADNKSLVHNDLGINNVELHTFVKWIEDTRVSTVLELIIIKIYILSAIIVASEICCILNYFGLIALELFFRSQLQTTGSILFVNFLLSSLILVITWAYNRFYFRDYQKDYFQRVNKGFNEYKFSKDC